LVIASNGSKMGNRIMVVHWGDDRNICAHPTFSFDGNQFVPSPELARGHIVQAANYLLTKTPVRGKVIIDRLYKLVQEESFPESDDKAHAVLSSDKYLGRVKESSARNFTIRLLKRFFKDKEKLNPDLFDRLCAALGSIRRLYPSIYSDAIKDKLNSLLAEADENLIIRLLPFLLNREEVWRYIEQAIVIRLEKRIESLDVKTAIFYKLPQVASINGSIFKNFETYIETLSPADLYELIKKCPCQALYKDAINIFIHSGSFASAYKNGTQVLIPHAEFFDKNDLQTVFDGIYANGRWNINQILNAGGIDEVLCTLFEKTESKILTHDTLWLNFWKKVHKDEYNFQQLEELLIEHKIIKATEPKENSDTENQDPEI